MKKRLLSLFLAFVTLLGILPTAALAANTEEEALGEVDIYIRHPARDELAPQIPEPQQEKKQRKEVER